VNRVMLDKIASVTAGLALDRRAVLGATIPAVAGTVVACRVKNAKTHYNTIEDVHGRMVGLYPGDVIAGALGHRDALLGYSGVVPTSVQVGDTLDLLNLGGVIGVGATAVPGLGEPFHLEVLGSVLRFPGMERRTGVPANVMDGSYPTHDVPAPDSLDLPPVVGLVGTCMNSGKTTAACALAREFGRRGMAVAGGKLTGVSLRRDVLEMADSGANPTAIFTDFGVVTTDASNAAPTARAILAHLASHLSPSPINGQLSGPDAIILEFGDGLLGTYGVDAILDDPLMRGSVHSLVLCAQDPVGAWGAVRLLADRYGLRPAAVSGRITDTVAGLRFCSEELGIPTWNALREPDALPAGILPSPSTIGALV